VNLYPLATVTAVALLTAALGGCSGDRELATQGQAAGFVVEVAGGESAGSWELASKHTAEAAQAWSDRTQIADFGRRLRGEGAAWTCEFAYKAVGLGSIGNFNQNDSGIVTREAAALGIPSGRIAATLRDLVTMRYRELVLVTTSICGPYKT